MDVIRVFGDRREAGAILTEALRNRLKGDCVVLAIPRGGVVVGRVIADALGLPLDVIVPRKIGAPGQPELAIGAVISWGNSDTVLDSKATEYLKVSEDYIKQRVGQELEEVKRRLLAYRGTVEPPNVVNKNVVLVDDGIATGYTVRAASLALRRLGAARVVLAVPVAPPDSLEALRPDFDEVICVSAPTPFPAVSYWYRDFRQVTDQEVVDMLKRSSTDY
jgi:putative phosphoribosyl transferase